MKLLLIDTCGTDGSMALVACGKVGGAATAAGTATMPGRSSSERMFPELRGMLDAAGWRIRDLTAIGVVSGPGSFTGVRVGVTAAKGLCEAGGVALVAVSRLLVLARKAGGGVGKWHALLDAGRGEFFYGRFGMGIDGCGGEGTGSAIEALLGREHVLAAVREAGGRIAVCEEGVGSAMAGLDPVMTSPLIALDLLPLVLPRVAAGNFDDVATVDANYLRRTDLEMSGRLGQGVLGR